MLTLIMSHSACGEQTQKEEWHGEASFTRRLGQSVQHGVMREYARETKSELTAM